MKRGFLQHKRPLSSIEPLHFTRDEIYASALARELRCFIESYYDGIYSTDTADAPDRCVKISPSGFVCFIRSVFKLLEGSESISIYTSLTYEFFTIHIEFENPVIDENTRDKLEHYARSSGFIYTIHEKGVDIKLHTYAPGFLELRSVSTYHFRSAFADYFFTFSPNIQST
jgi:hypothetical protein